MKKLIAGACLAALLCTVHATPAAAQGSEAAAAAAGAAAAGRDRGLMFRVGFGVDGCTDDWCDNIDPLVGVHAVVLYRVLRYFAAGLHAAFLFGDHDGSVIDVAWNFYIGAEGRGIFPYKSFDFWISLALGYNRTMRKGEICLPMLGCAEGRDWMNAFGLGFGFGADYFITKNIGVGINFHLFKPWPDEYCAESGGDTNCTEMTKDDLDNIGVIWSVNAAFTYYLPL